MERAFAENHRTGEKLLACSGFESDNPNDRNTELDSKKPRHTFARPHSFAYSCSRNNCALARERKNPMLKLHVLASGSKGNAAIAENAKTGTGVLIDCGICKRDFLERCDQAGFDPAGIEAVFITHEHGDHIKGLGVVLRGLAKLGCAPTIFANKACIDASSTLQKIADDFGISPLALEQGSIEAAGLNVLPFAISHDAAASFGFRIETPDGDALGYITDSGIVASAAHEALLDVRILALESNHDENMLKNGSYPSVIKRRIASELGHLSNPQATKELAALITESRNAGLRTPETVIAMHVSQNNNDYNLPRAALEKGLAIADGNARILCGYQGRLTSVG